MIVEKDVSMLSVGAYITRIVKQRRSYKLKSPGFVRDFKAIENLIEQGVLRVEVDTSKVLEDESSDSQSHQSGELSTPDGKQDQDKVDKKIKNSHFDRTKLVDQFFKAKALFSEAKSVQARVLSDIQSGTAIDAQSVVDMTDKTIDSIFENSGALACVINIRHKDEYLLEHSISVSVIMTIFAKHLKLPRNIVSNLAVGAFLHDVGKINVPMPVLNKPGKLTPEEYEVIKSHVVHSANIVNETEGLSSLSRQIVADHHEKLNGLGYPLGKNAEQLDQYSRMISICDIYDALTAERVYKKGMPQIKAFKILREIANNGELDLALVDQFIRCMGVYPVGSLVKLNTNKLAIVERANDADPIRPVVRTFFSLNQNTFIEAKDIDLAKEENMAIAQGVRADDFDLDMNKITEFLMIQG